MNITFKSTPVLFGKLHISFTILIIISNIIFNNYVKKLDEKRLLKLLHNIGLLMMISEVFKQIFCFYYVFDKTINLWFFPWQLCSVSMYLAFIAIYLNKAHQNTILVYLSTFNIFGDIAALIFPNDMLRDQIPLVFHSFIFHGLIISLAIISIHILKNRNNYNFKSSVILFLITAFIAEIVNITAHYLINNISREPNMFYISPYMATTQPVFGYIASNYGINIEIIIYTILLILSAYLFYRLEIKYLLPFKKVQIDS